MDMQFERHTKRDIGERDLSVVERMRESEFFRDCLNKEEHYHNFLEFFRQNIRAKGYEAVVQEYLLSGTPQADDLLSRMFAGFLHPLIHLGFGIEFKQPAIIAEALAQAALHDNYLLPYFSAAEEAARKFTSASSTSMLRLVDAVSKDEIVSVSAHWEDGNKLRDGVLHRAPDEMVKYASLWAVEPELEQLRYKTAEMVDAVVFFTAAAQHPKKSIKFDFYFMHCVNASIFFWSFLEQQWLRDTDKARLLEWKGRTDLAMYASRRAPALRPEDITQYGAVEGVSHADQWREIFERVSNDPEDGHASKFIRKLAWGEKLSMEFEQCEALALKGDMWLKIAHMVMDSVEGQDKRWVRSAGFEEAWVDIPAR